VHYNRNFTEVIETHRRIKIAYHILVMITAQSKNTFLSALNLLEDFANRKANGLLIVSANGVSWFVYFNEGKIFHANFSIDPLDRLELYTCQVLQAGQQRIDTKMFERLRQQTAGVNLESFYPSYDYQALYSLVGTSQLSVADGALIVRKITKEAMRSMLLLSDFSYDFVADHRQFPILWSANFLSLIKECQGEITDWQSLKAEIYSPYQRPFVSENNENLSKYNYLRKFLVGVDFNHLSLQLNRSAIHIAQSLDLLVVDGVVGLHPPQSQYNKLPKLSRTKNDSYLDLLPPLDLSIEMVVVSQYKIVSIDDSPAILQRMADFLDSTHFQLFAVQDSRMALSKIITVKPQVILMDIDMPNIDGYKLCTMVRRNLEFKNTPIIMVTSNSGFIDRAKAKLCGATDYLAKPFTQSTLNQIVLKYLVN
jgi:two-component system, chemotaxis family, response regulator PixG